MNSPAMDEKKVKKIESTFQRALKQLDFGSTLINLTDKSIDACIHLANIGAVESLLRVVEGQLGQGVYSKIMNGAVDVLYNMSKVDE